MLQGLPSIFQFALVLFGPESPRWLVSKGKEKQALQTLAYYHADGDENDPLVQYEFQEIKAAMEFDRTCRFNPAVFFARRFSDDVFSCEEHWLEVTRHDPWQ